ncbi:hypothetical protein BH10BDE1_BH10BDE1_05510 [soil metagenome]
MEKRLISIALGFLAVAAVGCSRDTSVYSDPKEATNVTPVSTNSGANLPKDFYSQSANQATVDLQPDGISATSKAIRFQTSSATNASGGFNGTGLGNRAILGQGAWHARPVAQAEPITMDAHVYNGAEQIGVNLQIDLKCDGSEIRVVNASGAAVAAEPTTMAGDGYTRLTASQSATIWLSPTSPILDPSTSAVLVPASGAAVSLTALLSKFPAACLKNAATSAIDLPRAIPMAAVLFSLGSDSTTSNNSVFVRRITIGSEVFEGLE